MNYRILEIPLITGSLEFAFRMWAAKLYPSLKKLVSICLAVQLWHLRRGQHC